MNFTITITERGRSWSPAEIAELGVTWTDAPLDDLGESLRRAGYRVEVLWSVGLMLHATVERIVTGATITDEQIREAGESFPESIGSETVADALGLARGQYEDELRPDDVRIARDRCAAAYNARHAVAPPPADEDTLP